MSEPKAGDRVSKHSGQAVTDWVKCRCGGELRVFQFAISHTLPYCDQFLRMEPLRYVNWVRLGDEN